MLHQFKSHRAKWVLLHDLWQASGAPVPGGRWAAGHHGAHRIEGTATWWMNAPRAEEFFYNLWLPEEVKRKAKACTRKRRFLLRSNRLLKNI